ncbi:MAG TPA: hypothetical protein VEX18_15125 [Polyangiaceae bacterium]|nr:hypothetical protein [Polyangiaceae bacterium]
MRLFVLIWGLGLSACAAGRQDVRHMWLPTYAFGAIGGGDVDVRDVCASGKARELSVGSTWSTLSVSVATLGIYTPREVMVSCVPLR